MSSVAASTAPGDLIADRYRVEGVLGRGGMGIVYDVVDIETGEALALKVLIDVGDRDKVKRFLGEARSTMQVESEHIVRVIAVGSINANVPYMVMERLVGATLRDHIDRAPLDERSVADLVIQACEGLGQAHAAGIIHRDVKPSNLFVTSFAPPRLKVVDFGISRASSLPGGERTAITPSDAFLGSPYYSSPEQLQDPSTVDVRADIWSLGVTIYNALTATFPFEGRSLAELFLAVMSKDAVPLASRVPCSVPMQRIVQSCLERSPERRYGSVRDLALALAPLASPSSAAIAHAVRGTVTRGSVGERDAPLPPRAPDDRTLTLDEPVRPPDDAPTEIGMAAPPDDAPTEIGMAAPPESFAPSRPTASAPILSLHRLLSGPLRRDSTRVVVVTLAAGLLAAGVGLIRWRSGDTPASAAGALAIPSGSASAADAPLPPATPVSSATPASSSSEGINPTVELELLADVPITRVIRPPAHRITLEEGRAFITVARFKDSLPVEVEVEGGGRARGTAREDGPTSIRLVIVPRRGAPGRALSRTSTTPSTSTGELQGSPYR